MPIILEGHLMGTAKHFAIVASRFNELVVSRLVEGTLNTLRRHGVQDDAITLTWVPGSFEIPVVAKTLASSGKYNAVIALGCVIRGETSHFDYVAGECASGIARAALDTGVPILFGVLTTNTLEEALERAGAKAGNKGSDAALAALEMADLMEKLRRV